jgi:hypothetical protein
VDQARVLLVAACALLGALAGCASDLERAPHDPAWNATVQAHPAPVGLVDERPAQIVVEGPLALSPADGVTLTGFEASVETDNRTVDLTPVRLAHEGTAQAAGQAVENELGLEDGDRVRLTLVPEAAVRLPVDRGPLPLDVSLQYRYRDGDAFDAGRFTVEVDATLDDAPGPATGVARVEDGEVTELVFADLDERVPDAVRVAAYHVGSSVSYEGHLGASVDRGEGAVTVALAEPHPVPEGSGYTVLRANASGFQAAVLEPDRAEDQALPLPGAAALVAGIAASLVFRARGQRDDGSSPSDR